MSSNVSVRVTGGNFRSGGALKNAIEQALGPAIRRAAMTQQGGIQRVTPVRTGTLRRSWTTAAPRWQGTQFTAQVGTNLVYARRVNLTSKRNKGFVQRGLDQSRSAALRELREGARGLNKSRLWEKK